MRNLCFFFFPPEGNPLPRHDEGAGLQPSRSMAVRAPVFSFFSSFHCDKCFRALHGATDSFFFCVERRFFPPPPVAAGDSLLLLARREECRSWALLNTAGETSFYCDGGDHFGPLLLRSHHSPFGGTSASFFSQLRASLD